MSPSKQLYQLIALCYEATSGESGSSKFAGQLARALSATGCAVVAHNPRSDSESVLWAHGKPPHRSGDWLPDRAGRRQARQIDKYLQSVVTSHGRFLIGQLAAKNGTSSVLVVFRGGNGPAFRTADYSLVSELMPHLARALHVLHTIRRSEDRYDALTEIMDRLPEAIFLVDVRGRIISHNRSARAIVRQNDGLLLVDNRIGTALPNEQASLRALIAEVSNNDQNPPDQSSNRPAETVLTMTVTRPSGRSPLPMVVTPVLCRGQLDDGSAVTAAVITKDSESRGSVLTPDLATAFQLTPGEARLAGLIADGMGLQDAANALGITRNTARTHMKRVYAKTGVHSQADLFRLLSHGSIELMLSEHDE